MSLKSLLPRLGDPDRHPAASELAALSGISGEERERFLDVWRGLSIQRRRDIIDALVLLGEDNVELNFDAIFLSALFDDDVQVRAESIKALWEHEGKELAPVLLKLLTDPEALVRAEAALGLGRYLLRHELEGGDDAQVAAIESALAARVRDETELEEVRGRALEALGVRSHPWVRELVEEAYDSGDRRLAISAVHAMGRSADPDWLPTVTEEMQSDDAEMRFEAATAAGGIGDDEALPHLAQLTGDGDAEVQEAAIAALGLIGGPAARSILHDLIAEDPSDRVREAVNDALAEADFAEDPLGVRVRLDGDGADDATEDE